jgi:ubiquitin-protein ligase
MTTQATIDIDTQITTDLDSLDSSMDKVTAHLSPWQHGATTMLELMALPQVTAYCGFTFNPSRRFPKDTPLACPKCVAICGRPL